MADSDATGMSGPSRRRRLGLVPVMLHPVFGMPVFLACCYLQQSKYGFAYMVLRAFKTAVRSADAAGTDAAAHAAAMRTLLDRVVPKVVAASPNCMALHAELRAALSAHSFLACVHMDGHSTVYVVRVPWMELPTSLPRACTFVPAELRAETLVAGGSGVCLELTVRAGGAAATYRALRFLPEDVPYLQTITLPHVLNCPFVTLADDRRAFLPFGTHYVVDEFIRAVAAHTVSGAHAVGCST